MAATLVFGPGRKIIISKNMKVHVDSFSLDTTLAFTCVDCKGIWCTTFDRWKLEDLGRNTHTVHWSKLLESDTHCPKCLAEQKEAGRPNVVQRD